MAINKAVRLLVLGKYSQHCSYCGKPITLKALQVDHKKSKLTYLSEGITDSKIIDHIDNLMPSCYRCNHYKRTETLEVFRKMLKTINERVMKIYIANVAFDYGMIELKEWNGVFYFEEVEGAGCQKTKITN